MRTLNMALMVVVACCTPHVMAKEPISSADRAKLVGVWQEGLTGEVRRMDDAHRMIFTGQVMAFDANGVFRLFPKCGKETADFKAMGMASMDGKWSFDAAGVLHVVMEFKGKRLDQVFPISFAGDDLILEDSPNAKPKVLGRYTGVLPAACRVLKIGKP